MSQLLRKAGGLMKLGRPKPVWYDVIATQPPLSFLDESNTPARSGKRAASTTKAVHKPPKLVFPEDGLRRKFYRNHPFEFDQTVAVGNSDGSGPAESLNVEWAVSRQLQLMETEQLPERAAYQRASQEYFNLKAARAVSRHSDAEGATAARPLGALLDEILKEEKEQMEQDRLQERRQEHVQPGGRGYKKK